MKKHLQQTTLKYQDHKILLQATICQKKKKKKKEQPGRNGHIIRKL